MFPEDVVDIVTNRAAKLDTRSDFELAGNSKSIDLETMNMSATTEERRENSTYVQQSILDNIRQSLSGLQFGEITITVRDGHVVLIERISRKRQFKSRSGVE